jgi:hypothetical protein
VRYQGAVTIDEALTALGAALAGAGVPLWRAPETLADLDELEAELAPMRLPEALREFWTRVDVATLRVEPYPNFTTPKSALEDWRMSRDEFPGQTPLAFVNVGYESHDYMSVELDIDEFKGGALFESDLPNGTGFDRRFNGLADWLGYVAELIAQGNYEGGDPGQPPWLLVPDRDRADAAYAARPVPESHPVHGDALHIGPDILDWPEHWQRASGVQPENLLLRGATHTVAGVLASPPGAELRATIAARVADLAFGAGWTHVRVDDDSGALNVACPGETTLLGPGVGGWFEFDIVVAPGVRQVPVDPDAAAAGIEDDVERITAVLMARYGGPAGATAEAIRRMPAPPE